MAWTGLALTVEGRNALNQAQLSNRINFKSIVVGDGAAPVNFRTLKGLVHPLYEITDIKVDVTEDGCILTADFPKVEYDYYFREIGILVTTDEGDKLYVYDNCGDDAQYMVSTTGVETTKKRIRLSLAISDVAEITVSAAEILYVAYDDYEKTVEILKQDLQEENGRAEIAEKNLAKKLLEESTRARAAENVLAENLQKETSRAEAAEETNKNNLANHTADKANPHKVTKAQIGLGNVNNTADVDKPVSMAQQNALNSAYQQATGYTDRKIADLIGGAPETLDTLKEVADAIQVNKNVSEALDAAIGKKANQAELDTHTGNTTIHITSTERTNWNDANTKKHTHSNKSILDKVTQVLLDNWNAAYTHISDTVKHITAAERTLWNTVSNKVDKVSGKGLSANDYTTADKKKLDGIAEHANNYAHPTTAGSKHIPAGGSAGKILRWSADGTATWGDDNDTKVTQQNVVANVDNRLLLSNNANDTNETAYAKKSAKFLANPFTGELYADGYRRIMLDGKTVDLNSLNLSGGYPMIQYYIERTDGGALKITNAPVSGKPFILEVSLIRWASASDYRTLQRFITSDDYTHEYVRLCTNGSWSAWVKCTYTADNVMSNTSENPVQNKVVTKALNEHAHGLLHTGFAWALPAKDGGWELINSKYNGYILKSIRGQQTAPKWFIANFASGIAFGGEDTHGVMSVAYNIADIKFAGGNGTKPVWWLEIVGTNNKKYDLNGFSLTNHTHTAEDVGALSLENGGVVKQTVKLEGGTTVHYMNSGAGSTGYFKFATIKITSQYQNEPIVFELSSRGRVLTCVLYLAFASADHNDPAVGTFYFTGGNYECYIHKSATSVWNLYVKKAEAYDRIDVVRYHKPTYMSGCTLEWTDSYVSSVPGGAVAAKYMNKAGCAIDAGNNADITFQYSGEGIGYGVSDWLAVWNGYKLMGIDKKNFAKATDAKAEALYVPRVARTCNNLPGKNKLVVEEYTSGTAYNLPTGQWYHIITCEGSDINYATQIAIGMTTRGIYYRNYFNGIWNTWNKLVFDDVVTQSASGLMSSTDKKKLDGIAEGANKITVDSALSNTSTNPVQNKVIKAALDGKAASGHAHSNYYDSTTSRAANTVLAAPNGSHGRASFRKLTIYDLPVTLGNDTWETIPYIRADGGMEIGKYIDFHISDGNTSDNNARIIADENGITFIGTVHGKFKGDFSNEGLSLGTNTIFSESGLHLQAASDSKAVYTHGSALYVYSLANSSGGFAYKPVYASAFSVQSSRRYKENIVDMADADAEKLLDIGIRRFDYINGKKNAAGCIAEEIENIFPDVCVYGLEKETDTEEKLIGIDYSKFVPYLMKMIQIQQKEINSMKEILQKMWKE